TSTPNTRTPFPRSATARTLPRGRRKRSSVRTLLAFFVFSFGAFAAEPTPGVLEVSRYAGPDRTARLLAGAKKEGELMLYSSLTPDDQIRFREDFRRRTGVTVNFWRGSQTNILQRLLTETRGGRFEFD